MAAILLILLMTITTAFSHAAIAAPPASKPQHHLDKPIVGLPRAAHNDYRRAIALCDLGKYREARALLLEMNSRYPDQPMILEWLSKSYMNDYDNMTANFKIAEKYLLKAVQINPDFGAGWGQLAHCMLISGDKQRAFEYANKAIACRSQHPDAFRVRAIIYGERKNKAAAIADSDEYLKRVTDIRPAILVKASILENFADYKGALALLEQAQKLHYDDATVYQIVSCMQHLNQYDLAIKQVDQLLVKNKSDEYAMQIKAKLFATKGDYKGAIKCYSDAIDQLPSASMLKERAKLYDKIGDKAAAARDRAEADRI
ncbi:MAG: hypothetical protein J0H83_10805 [Candidatus Melainabacteria bacterium]|jgi:tetratricopeptide (TPR) repeat protein|nr:hypothetical protein [Candidatus Melainabacteria bacterium]